MSIVTQQIKDVKEYKGILANALSEIRAERPHPMSVTGLSEGASEAFYNELVVDIKQQSGKGVLLVCPDEKTEHRLKNALESCGRKCLVYPYRDLVFHNITASREFEHDRLNVLYAIMENDYDVVLTTPDAALQYTVPEDKLEKGLLEIDINKQYEIKEVTSFLENNGYTFVDMVDSVGQYAVRGGILDVFSPRTERPVRIDFFDTDIEQMGSFDVLSQRKIENIDSFKIIPSKEVIVSPEKREELKKAISSHLKKIVGTPAEDTVKAEYESVISGSECNFADKYISLLYPEKQCLLDYLNGKCFCVVHSYSGINDRIKSFQWHEEQNSSELIEIGSVPSKYAEFSKTGADFEEFTDKNPTLISDTFLSSMGNRRLSGVYSFVTKQTVSYFENFSLLLEDLSSYVQNKYKIAILTESEQKSKTLLNMLNDAGIAAVLGMKDGSELIKGLPCIVDDCTVGGFELTASKFVCLSLRANSGLNIKDAYKKKKKKANKKTAREKILSYADLTEGDYVVHDVHGIGQYLGLHTLTIDGITKDFVKIQYAGSDMLYLPCTQLDSIAKYIGAKAEDGTLKLSKMGGTEWYKAKTKVKKAAKDMAKDLIALYAERLRKKGIAFDKDDAMQADFESGFEYEETDGQLSAINEIKEDMEQAYPMDRLLCGDVGFGKTEVALRAAFKAVNSSKQVAILVPTTILALQHYQTISARMRGFPVKIDMLSRFSTPKQQAETVRRIKRGETDIVVGTHRLLSKDIEFKDLGLVIIDEEQRFGVAHKEKLKQLTKNIDSLTLTATPIPRTLNMAMSGIRDMSVLEEAPGDRLPVQSYVLEYDELIISEAIKKELRRGGQVFYLHNNIETIDYAARRVAAMVPDARIAIAHGRMDKETISDLWRSLVEGEIDVFVSTTIIESGVDVPNANTLIIENADRFGLAQLHQIRGRVGRSSRRAYAYFTFSKGKALSEIATKRLSAIKEYTEFGAGFKVALRDLEIRGAGNILGAEQHGHLQTVGYDMYMKLLNEAILEEKGEEVKPKRECAIDLNVNAYIPEKYIKVASQRIDIYKKIALIETELDVRDVTDELLDRYGDIPESVLELLNVSLLRKLGSDAGMAKLEKRSGNILIYPYEMDGAVWTFIAAQNRGKILMNMGSKPYVSIKLDKGAKVYEVLTQILREYMRLREELK
ncbi:MAG: transcription-repair coupling factor [Ruminococcaceae bacterium]|nr:transcription-repair coupling factor [Oscillospiraceae bacterium]